MARPGEQNIYARLALLWTDATWGWFDHLPPSGALETMLRESLSEDEAQALCDIPLKTVPLDFVTLDEIAARSDFPPDRLEQLLDGVASRRLLFSKTTQEGKKAYALLKAGYGYSQIFFWDGGKHPRAQYVAEYFKSPEIIKATLEMHTTIKTKPFRYIPTTEAIDPQWQNVYPSETIEKVIEKAFKIALAQCPCRIRYEFQNGKPCGHSLDVCIKLNELAELIIDAGLAKEISHEEAVQVLKKAQAEGLVHFADNTGEDMKHICNCCGDACWNVGPIRRRQVPRDALLATYFLRETNEEKCIACGECVKICPVAAVELEDGVSKVDLDWCIGCGVCVPRCSTDAIRLVGKLDKPRQSLNFADLHMKVNIERSANVEARSEQSDR